MDSVTDRQGVLYLVTDDAQSAQVLQVAQTSPLVYSYNVICMCTPH